MLRPYCRILALVLNVSDMGAVPQTRPRAQKARFARFARWGWDEKESDARAAAGEDQG